MRSALFDKYIGSQKLTAFKSKFTGLMKAFYQVVGEANMTKGALTVSEFLTGSERSIQTALCTRTSGGSWCTDLSKFKDSLSKARTQLMLDLAAGGTSTTTPSGGAGSGAGGSAQDLINRAKLQRGEKLPPGTKVPDNTVPVSYGSMTIGGKRYDSVGVLANGQVVDVTTGQIIPTGGRTAQQLRASGELSDDAGGGAGGSAGGGGGDPVFEDGSDDGIYDIDAEWCRNNPELARQFAAAECQALLPKSSGTGGVLKAALTAGALWWYFKR